MVELGTIGKIMKALDLSKEAEIGVTFDYFQALELRGYIKSLEEELGLAQEESKKDYEDMRRFQAKYIGTDQELLEWKDVAQMLADELNEANSERFPVSWEDASESSPAWIAYCNLRDRSSNEAKS
jgi:hypothetical protein